MPTINAIGLIALLSAAPSFAQNLVEYPGWRLDQAAQTEPVDPASLEYKDYFTLTPPGSRPPITVDGGTAARLLNGQANPETIYAERTASGTDKKKGDASSGGNGAVGWQVAESTYVPVGEEKSRNPATAITGSSSYAGMAGNGATGGVNIGSGGAGSMNTGFGGSASPNLSVGAGIMSAGNSGSSAGGAFNNFNGGTAGKAPAYSGGTGSATSNVDTSNMTYSQMIESANTEATKSACARFGSYAQGGFCSGK